MAYLDSNLAQIIAGWPTYRPTLLLRKSLKILVVTALLLPAVSYAQSHSPERSRYVAPLAAVAPTVNGTADDPAWELAEWRAMDQVWLGPDISPTDFAGRYKVVWTPEKLYLLGEFTDDILYDAHRDPLQQYWDDDCLEIFLDEDYSGGDHQYNHNAFAYHVSLDNQSIDIGTDQSARIYSHHVQSRWQQHGEKIIWELAIDIYDDSYDDEGENRPVSLIAGKILGLMLAYCDNDGSELRENFIGSESVLDGPADRGWIDAGLFGELILGE